MKSQNWRNTFCIWLMKLHRIKALLFKHWCITKNSIERIFDLFYWPLLDILTWGFMSIFLVGENVPNLLNVFIGSAVLWVFVWRNAQDFSVYLLEEFWSKNLYHLFASPIRASEHIASLMILGILRGFVSFIFLTGVAYLLYHLNIFMIPPAILGLSMLNLMLFGWAIGIFINTIIFWMGKRMQVIAWSVVWIVYPFSCLFYPLSSLPSWAHAIAKVLPTTWTFESLRAVFNSTPIPTKGIIYAISMDLVLIIVGFLLLGMSIKRARMAGRLAKPE